MPADSLNKFIFIAYVFNIYFYYRIFGIGSHRHPVIFIWIKMDIPFKLGHQIIGKKLIYSPHPFKQILVSAPIPIFKLILLFRKVIDSYNSVIPAVSFGPADIQVNIGITFKDSFYMLLINNI